MTPTRAPEFRDIPGHPGYQSDRQGNIRRQSRDGHFPQRIPGGWKYLTGTVQKRGCRVYCLPTNSKRVYLTSRQAALKAFGETWPAKKSHIFKMTPEQHDQPGERNGNHRLTELEVIEIRGRLKTSESGAAIARDFGVTKSTVYWIRDGITWKHLLPTGKSQ